MREPLFHNGLELHKAGSIDCRVAARKTNLLLHFWNSELKRREEHGNRRRAGQFFCRESVVAFSGADWPETNSVHPVECTLSVSLGMHTLE